uniref:PAT complex subunit CCDC47 n=1 Tax=Panagrellus redivivus TaxID=6233 RepID=A0A7E4V2D0_PANRE
MRLFRAILICLAIALAVVPVLSLEFEEDNEFAEFEVADEVPVEKPPVKSPVEAEKVAPPKAAETETKTPVNDKDADDFAHLSEEEEFDIEEPKQDESEIEATDEKKPLEIKPLQFTDIPNHFRTNWSSYQVEALALSIIAIYMLNYLHGRQRNQSIANQWFQDVEPNLTDQFALVGDDGTSSNPEGGLLKETDYSYVLWCSGRVGVQGLLCQLRMIKRQDVIGLVYNWYKPRTDKVTYKFELDSGELDPIVLVLGNKKNVTKAVKELADLSTYAIERKGLERFSLPASFGLWAEIPETISAVLDPYVVNLINQYEKYIDLIHISDQFCGLKLQEGETYTRLPDTTPSMFFTYNIIPSEDSGTATRALLTLSIYLVDKLRRYRLSREGKAKADKKRQSVEESYLKVTHQQRQEIAQARREEKARERKQRLLEEEDPEKQRRLQKLEDKRELKAKQPKMKQVRMK